MEDTATTKGKAPLSRGPQPGWMTLNEARERAFTGEIVFETDPETRAYLDNGVVYYAERAGDAPFGQRLLEAGLVDHVQLERGTVRVGEIEHLGRLFDRAPSVDRDAVVVATELATEDLVTELANNIVTTVRSTAYRHHPSGLHRWFVVPIDPNAPAATGMMPLDAGVVHDIPGLPIITDHALADHLYIEWDEPIIGGEPDAEDAATIDDFDDSMLQAILDNSFTEFLDDEVVFDLGDDDLGAADPDVADVADVGEFVDVAPITDDLAGGPAEFAGQSLDEEFRVVWPTGEVPATVVESERRAPTDAAETGPDTETARRGWDVVDEPVLEESVEDHVVEEPVEEWVEDHVAEDQVVDEPVVEDHVEESVEHGESEAHAPHPEQVVIGNVEQVVVEHADQVVVTRADQVVIGDEVIGDEVIGGDVIGHVIDHPGVADELPMPDGELPAALGGVLPVDDEISVEIPEDVTESVRRAIAALESATVVPATLPPIPQPGELYDSSGVPAAQTPPAPAAATFAGFAPPSLDMSAEAIYARSVAASQSLVEAPAVEARSVESADAAPTVFTEESVPGDEHSERQSALRRLISSLRRKDR